MTAAVACSLLLAGCGESSSRTPAALQDRVGAVVEAANGEDYAAVRTALGALREDVAAADRLDSITPERAAELSRLADQVEAGLPAPPSPSPVPSPVAPPVQQAPPAPAPAEDDEDEDDKDDEKDDDEDRGKGKGRDD